MRNTIVALICTLACVYAIAAPIPTDYHSVLSPKHVRPVSLSQHTSQTETYMTSSDVAQVINQANSDAERQFQKKKGKAPTPDGNIYFEYYWVPGMEDLDTLVMMPGGPGYPHNVFNSLKGLAASQPLLLFDPLATGKSDWPRNQADLWTQEHFVEQFEALRRHLGIKSLHILGHSWGCMVAVDYYFKYKDRVSSLILVSPPLSGDMWREDGQKLMVKLRESDPKLSGLSDIELDQAYTEAYILEGIDGASIADEFGRNNDQMYSTMWGTSEPLYDGSLKDYDRLADLPSITVPSLYMCGEHDEATPETTQYYADLTPTAGEIVVLPNSGHASMLSAPEEFKTAVDEFLTDVRAKQATVAKRMETFDNVCFDADNAVDWSVGVIGGFMIKARLPSVFRQYKLDKPLQSIISNFPTKRSCRRDDNDNMQAVTDLTYFTSVVVASNNALAPKYQPGRDYIQCVSERILAPMISQQQEDLPSLLYGYVFARTFMALGIEENTATQAKQVAENILGALGNSQSSDEEKLIYGYYLTHVIIYDTVFGSKDPYSSQDERHAVVEPLFDFLDWLASQWESAGDLGRISDLTSEVIVSINWAGVNARAFAKTHQNGRLYEQVRQANDRFSSESQNKLRAGAATDGTGLCHEVATQLCATFV